VKAAAMSVVFVVFVALAVLAVAGAINLIAQRHPIHSALSLIVVMVALAGEYLLMGAEFIAAVQIIVYAGAIMVLFVFVIMLLNAGIEERTNLSRIARWLGLPVAAILLAELAWAVRRGSLGGGQHSGGHGIDIAPCDAAVSRLRVSVRVDVGFDSGGDHGRDRAGQARRVAPGGLAPPQGESVVPVSDVLVLSAVLFGLGVIGFVFKRDIVTLFMCIELMLNAVNLAFVAFSRVLGELQGQIYVFFVIVVAAAESAVGLAIVILIVRNRRSLNVERVNSLKL
jgi:NADH:ubiquinone oxidoreductase subunit K/NADH:ubiquinone oxidoreductase subunit 6 (subunit J)